MALSLGSESTFPLVWLSIVIQTTDAWCVDDFHLPNEWNTVSLARFFVASNRFDVCHSENMSDDMSAAIFRRQVSLWFARSRGREYQRSIYIAPRLDITNALAIGTDPCCISISYLESISVWRLIVGKVDTFVLPGSQNELRCFCDVRLVAMSRDQWTFPSTVDRACRKSK